MAGCSTVALPPAERAPLLAAAGPVMSAPEGSEGLVGRQAGPAAGSGPPLAAQLKTQLREVKAGCASLRGSPRELWLV